MKNILILTTSYGHGHLATARALEEGLRARSTAPIAVEIVDFTETISSLLNKTSKRVYEDTAKYAPLLYKLFYESTDYELPIKAFNSVNYRISREKILDLFRSKQPDLIICNSPHWQYIASLAREQDFKNTPLISVITDSITIHASWSLGDSDYYITPNQETSQSLQKLGIESSKILALGYPISLVFSDKTFYKANFFNDIGLKTNVKSILLLANGMRTSVVSKTIHRLQDEIPYAQLIVITGQDELLYPKLKTIFGPTIHLLKWTDKLPQYIMSSDLVITKAGGSTVMECLGAKKPVIISKIIPGQEVGNAEYISRHKLGIVALDPDMIVVAATLILNNLTTYHQHLTKAAQPKATSDIADFLLNII